MKLRARLLAAACSLAAAVTVAATAQAQQGRGPPSQARAARPGDDTARGEVLVVLASEQAGTIDPALASVPALRQPPFNSFHSMRVLSRPRIQLSLQRAIDVPLPNGRRLRLILEEKRADGRFKVRVSINRPNQNDYLPLLQVVASPGDPFFVAGQSYQGGTLVIGVRIGAARTAPPGLQKVRPVKLRPGARKPMATIGETAPGQLREGALLRPRRAASPRPQPAPPR